MRSMSRRARWAICALALAIALPAAADRKDRKNRGSGASGAAEKKKVKSIAECTAFDQVDREAEDGVDFSVHNSCGAPLACSIQWTVTCAPESKKRRSRKVESQSFGLESSTGITLTASAARCGNDSWSLSGISWNCAPRQ
jgi:hypothetical protein